MHHSKGTKVSSLTINDAQSTPTAPKISFMEMPITSIKSKMLTIKNKSFKRKKGDAEDEVRLINGRMTRSKSIEIHLPRSSCLPQQANRPAREFPQNWQTTIGPAQSCLRARDNQSESDQQNKARNLKQHKRCSSSQVWPSGLGCRSKFVRFIVVASPRLQRLSFMV